MVHKHPMSSNLGSDKPVVARNKQELQLINASTTLDIGVASRYLDDSDFFPSSIAKSSRIFLNSYLEGGSNNGKSLEFKQLDVPRVKLLRSVLDGVSSSKPFDIIKFTPGNRSSDLDVFLAVGDTVRGIARYFRTIRGGFSEQIQTSGEQFLGGIAIKTGGRGNDLILSSGPGAERSNTSTDSYTLVNRTSSFVDIQNGDDAVIGGFGKDYIGSRSFAELDALSSEKRSMISNSKGSKFFIGGSSSDVLDGGTASDYLVGDRFNGYELYLKSSNFSSLLPATSPWSSQSKYLQTLQSKLSAGVGNQLTGLTVETLSTGFVTSRKPYSLWMPGNDVIRSYEGNDIVFGDDNAVDNLAQLKVLKDNITGVNPSDPDKYGAINSNNFNSVKLGADFIDVGAGNDEVYAGFGSDAIIGGSGADFIDTGAQVVVKGYTPFFGPKVVFGDRAFWNGSEWKSDPDSKAPDIFIVGALYTRETEIQASNSQAFLNFSQSSSIRETVEDFENEWKSYGKVLGHIPKIGVVAKVADVAITLIKTLFPAPKPLPIAGESVPKANDALTVIKDFDPYDQLTFSLAMGEQYEIKKTNLTLAGDPSNPLLGKIQNKRGTIIEVRGDAGTAYNRIFLEGYDSGLVSLKTEETRDAIFYTLGGRDFGDITDAGGNAVYGGVF